MSKSWFPFYGGDFLKATMDLTPEEIGCYVLLLIHYYQHGGLPESSKNLAVITKCSGRKWRAIAQALAPKFESGWVNTRAEKELIKQQEIAAKRQKAGRDEDRVCFHRGKIKEKAGPVIWQPDSDERLTWSVQLRMDTANGAPVRAFTSSRVTPGCSSVSTRPPPSAWIS